MKCPKCNTNNPDTLKFCGECGTRLSSIQDIEVTETMEAPKEELTTGSTFAGRYQIIEELGSGGMGKVYKATDSKINEKVALKLIKPEIASDKKILERFANELRIARKIVHKNVGRMYDINEDKETHYITMEYVSGQDLGGLIRQSGQLGIGTALSIAKQVCEGLEAAHKLDVIHRDLKSSNIMIDREGNVRIMDFGIARSLKEKGLTDAGVMIGTPEYMSPEQVEGKAVDQRSDIYSLGVILHEMVTGRVPFEGETPLGIAMKHKSEMPKDPREFNSQIPEDLSRVIIKCMEKDKEKRYQSSGEVSAELSSIERGIRTTESVAPQEKSKTSKEITVSFSTKRLFLPALVVIAIAITGLFIWSPWSQKGTPTTPLEKPSIAVLPFKDLSPQMDQQHLCSGIASDLVLRLTKVQDLWIPAWASSSAFNAEDIDIKEVGRKLNVKTALTGTLQKADDKLRISVELINIADNDVIWSDKYERDERDIFKLQDDVTLMIIDKLKVKLLGEDRAALIKRYTDNVEAYNFYLLGRHFWNKRTGRDMLKSIEYFEQAIEVDPEYALAYVGLSDCYLALPWYTPSSSESVMIKSMEYAQKALAIDDSLAEAHTSLAWLKMELDYDWTGAEEEFKKAIDLNYNYSAAHHWYALFLAYMGRFKEATSEINIALELDPISLIINRNVGQVYLMARKYDKVIEALKKTLELDNSFSYAHGWLGKSYFQKSMYDEALAELRIERDLSKGQNPTTDMYLGIAYALMGQEAEANKILTQIESRSKQEYISPVWLACLYHSLGEIDKSFEFLDRAYEERDVNLMYIKEHAWFESFRSDPRYKMLLKKMNLE